MVAAEDREYAEKKVTARECFPWPKMLIECPVEKNKKGVVYGKVAVRESTHIHRVLL